MIRLQKVLADRGVASRRRAEELIIGGRVRVDGEAVTTLGTRVRPDARIDVDGVVTREAARRYVLLNKPMGIVSSAHDERGRKTVVDVVGAEERLYPVGRLDTDSEGMLLLTNDGEWAERVLHPRYGHEREYDVSVTGELTNEAIAQLRNGIRLEEGLAVAAHIEVRSRSRNASRLRIVLRTGWRRQIRRMLAAAGLKTVRLVRVRIGSLPIGNLREGEWRELTAREIAELARPASRDRSSKPAPVAAPRPARPVAGARAAPRPARPAAGPRSAPRSARPSAGALSAPRSARQLAGRRPARSGPPSPARRPSRSTGTSGSWGPSRTTASRAPVRRQNPLLPAATRRYGPPGRTARPQSASSGPRKPARRQQPPRYGAPKRGPVRARVTPR